MAHQRRVVRNQINENDRSKNPRRQTRAIDKNGDPILSDTELKGQTSTGWEQSGLIVSSQASRL
jgi:hypothetical protein